ncbi:MAG: DUF1269 domain-containing protein [Aquabacterium sp.]|uniref:DUF1269 domain-containing protein n=1 Tax=Aquabacterium sp. TaxID=1872578 RepID=UPI0025BA355B|nr:DUF1269 domain-containing protein [Aquabacterium sp.]MBI5925363.1 DUF1269 domain-containing protein [Aquabacterium sp.]
MRHRIYWLLPDLASARRAMDQLLLARIEHRHLHFHAREGTDLGSLHKASALQSSDLVSAAQRGLALGAALGAACGALFAFSPWLDDANKPALVAALSGSGALFGAWTASMVGVSVPSRRLARFKWDIEHGMILLMADIPHSRVKDIEALMEANSPDAHFEGHDPHVPSFP